MATAEVTLTPKTTRKRGKQTDLPSMENHQRRIAEIEDLADVQMDLTDRMVASMKRHDKTFYQRQTWGKVILKESKTKAKVTKAVPTTVVDGDGEAVDADDEE